MPVAATTVAILAGGAATRLDGRDKGLQPLGGRPLIGWVVDALRAMCGDTPFAGILIVANRHVDEYAAYAATIRDDADGFRGPLAGVAAALRHCGSDWLLTLPVDCPRPPVDLHARLFAAARQCESTAVVAHDGERRQPLFALYRRELAGSAAAAVESGQGVWQWQASIGARELDFSDRHRQFQNLNTPQEFAAYAAEHAL
ncbi:MAG TPA: molybdenum cofactor guanylyltransferase MobA [Dokdonella sp.]